MPEDASPETAERLPVIALDRAWQEHMNALDFMRRQGNAIYGGSPDEVLHAYEQAAHRRFARVMSAVEPAARQIITDTLRQPP